MAFNIFRSKEKNLFARLLLGFVVIVVLSWSFSGLFSHYATNDIVGRIGKQEITVQAFEKELTLNAQQALATIQDDSLTSADLIKAYFDTGFADSIWDKMFKRAVLDQACLDLGLTVSDEELSEWVAQDPAFQNDSGQFDKQLFSYALRAANMTQKEYFQILTQRVLSRNLLNALTSPFSSVPDVLVHLSYMESEQKRSGDYIIIRPEAFPEPKPTPQQLERYYDQVKHHFDLPEKRSFEILVLNQKNVSPKLSTDAAYRKALDMRDDIENELASSPSPSFKKIAKKFNVQFYRFDRITAQDKLDPIPQELLIQNIFQPNGEASLQDINTRKMGDTIYWYRVTHILPSVSRPLTKIYAIVEKEWQGKQRLEKMEAFAQELMAKVKQGHSLKEVAQEAKLPIHTISSMQYSDDYRPLFMSRPNRNHFFRAPLNHPFLMSDGPQKSILLVQATRVVWPKNQASANQLAGLRTYWQEYFTNTQTDDFIAALSETYGGPRTNKATWERIRTSYAN